MLKGYADGARRCSEGGLDGAEVIAWGHLLDQFLSPALNRRDDAYGGSVENRCRFALEVFQAIRDAVGPDFVVGIRMTGDEHVQDGREPEECVEHRAHPGRQRPHRLLQRGRRHAGDRRRRSPTRSPAWATATASSWSSPAGIRTATGLPVFQASRIPDLATARWALEQGFVDMVGMTRAHIADPHIVAKLLRGEEHRIRPCVGMGYCIDRIYQGKDALCIHNAATGREATMPHVVEPSGGPRRKVVIVGGGVGGMEAARVAASRGHEVVLLEATDRLGGQVVLAAKAPGREEIIGIAGLAQRQELELPGGGRPPQYLRRARGRAGGEPGRGDRGHGRRCPTRASSRRARIWSTRSGTSWAAMSSPRARSSSTTTMAGTRGPRPPWRWRRRACEVEMVTPDRMIAFEVGATNYPNYLRDTYRHGVRRLPPTSSCAASAARATASSPASGTSTAEETVEEPADHVVVEHGTMPADELYRALRDGSRNGGEVDLDGLVTGAPEEIVTQPGRRLLPLSGRRRRLLAQHPRRDLRRSPALQEPVTQGTNLLVLIVFTAVYLGMALGRWPGLRIDRTGIALFGAIVLYVGGVVDGPKAVDAIDFPTLILLFGLMVLSSQYAACGFYAWSSRRIARTPWGPQRLLALTVVTAGLLSAVLANDVVVFAMTPLLVTGIQRRGLDPKPFVIALASAANAGSAATLIGNPQNILIGQVGGLEFWPFLAACGPPALVGLLCVQLVVAWLWRGRSGTHRHGSSQWAAGPLAPRPQRPAQGSLLYRHPADPVRHAAAARRRRAARDGRAPGEPQPRHASHAGPGGLAPAGAVREPVHRHGSAGEHGPAGGDPGGPHPVWHGAGRPHPPGPAHRRGLEHDRQRAADRAAAVRRCRHPRRRRSTGSL